MGTEMRCPELFRSCYHVVHLNLVSSRLTQVKQVTVRKVVVGVGDPSAHEFAWPLSVARENRISKVLAETLGSAIDITIGLNQRCFRERICEKVVNFLADSDDDSKTPVFVVDRVDV